MPVSIAVLGAGIFAREEYIPVITSCSSVSLKAVYSRSKRSSEALASQSNVSPDIYYDTLSAAGKSLDDLLQRQDIEAVIICLPILVQPEVIRKSLASGKHVLSEKPMAKDAETARELIQWHGNHAASKVWMVAENLRFIDCITVGASKMRELGGHLTTFSMNLFTFVDEKNKFYQTEWRKMPEYQGGFLLDGGVHFIAGLRSILDALGQDIREVAAYTSLLEDRLAPVDTIHAILRTGADRSGSFNLSFGTEFKSGFEIEVVTTKGTINIARTYVKVVRKDTGGEKKEEQTEVTWTTGVKAEVEAFAASIKAGFPDPRGAPEQALADLRVLQSMLASGEQHGAVKSTVEQ
ncbi:hypothetical protein BDV06DRAFT_216134 [Aspergillus oleicola]